MKVFYVILFLVFTAGAGAGTCEPAFELKKKIDSLMEEAVRLQKEVDLSLRQWELLEERGQMTPEIEKQLLSEIKQKHKRLKAIGKEARGIKKSSDHMFFRMGFRMEAERFIKNLKSGRL